MTHRRRISFLRLLLLVLVLGAIGTTAAFAVRRSIDDLTDEPVHATTWFAPYVDVTEPRELHFEDRFVNPAGDVVLGFIVAARDGACVPTWGTYYDVAGAGKALDLDRRVTRVHQRRDDVIASFGGQANDELAVRCDSAAALGTAYQSVIDRYGVTTVDFDLEGNGLTDAAARTRRARAVAALQSAARRSGSNLAVWLTLPVSPLGLSDDGIAAVDAMLAAHVDLAGVNAMTMDYGDSKAKDASMFEASRDALDATFRQLSRAYLRAHERLADRDVWRKIGATPMIGQNDDGSQFTIADAKHLATYAREKGLGRVSMWSANRDHACGAQLDLGTVSNSCSGVHQRPQEFGNVFARLPGSTLGASKSRTRALDDSDVRDDPATSPHPIWDKASTYTAGAKVTWHRNVYQAKWWTRSDAPDEPVVHDWDTPWRYLGPVLPGDHPATTTTLRGGIYPTWATGTVYVKGDRVEWHGVAYEARWWTRGDEPAVAGVDPDGYPWVRVT